MRKYTDQELSALSTAELHSVDESYRSRANRADAGRRAAEGSEGGIYAAVGWDCESPAQAYHDKKHEKWSGLYGKTRSALEKRGEQETTYTTENRDVQAGVRDFATKGGPIERIWKHFSKKFK